MTGRSCRCCGLGPADYPAASSRSSDCPLCAACTAWSRPRIDEEFVVIWLPEVSQPAINHLVRSCQIIFHVHGESAAMVRRPRSDTPSLRSAYRTFRSLLSLRSDAGDRFGTTSPRDLHMAVAGLPADRALLARDRMRDVRLLSLGHLFEAGFDVYPDILEAWVSGPCGDLVL